ncbi:MAG: type IV pilin N-terminal domain-containing protein, partial [Methanocorpusculum sp.]|nr:type IV pilin N-terminal domain-containing protein [Methanocorpusculum sp.]
MCSDAVSEVVGVMILLGITIVIFTVVASFAGGMMSSPDKAITSSISAAKAVNDGELNITFENTGGGVFALGDIRIILTNETRAAVTVPGSNMTSFSLPEKLVILLPRAAG